jgi:hypothetical protein
LRKRKLLHGRNLLELVLQAASFEQLAAYNWLQVVLSANNKTDRNMALFQSFQLLSV